MVVPPLSGAQAMGPLAKERRCKAPLPPRTDDDLMPVTDLYFDGSNLVGRIKRFMGTIEEGHGYICVPGQQTDLVFYTGDIGPDVQERARQGYSIVNTSVHLVVREDLKGPPGRQFRATEITLEGTQLGVPELQDAPGAPRTAVAMQQAPSKWGSKPGGHSEPKSGSDKLLDGAVMAGVVKTYSERTGYGSIVVTEDPSTDIFFQTSDLGDSLQTQLRQNANIVGGMVLFGLERGQGGSWHARSIAIPLDFATPDSPDGPPLKQQRLDHQYEQPPAGAAEAEDGTAFDMQVES